MLPDVGSTFGFQNLEKPEKPEKPRFSMVDSQHINMQCNALCFAQDKLGCAANLLAMSSLDVT